MTQPAVQAAPNQLRAAGTDEERLQVFGECADALELTDPDEYELDATSLAVARNDTIDFAIRVFEDHLEADSATRFLVFAAGAIACRRGQDKRRGESLFGLAGDEFANRPLFKHLQALSLLDGRLPELKRGLQLERAVLAETAPHPGASHALASFTLQLHEYEDGRIGETQLEEALEAVNEAIHRRPSYAKFLATRAAIYRQMGRFREAHDDLLDAISLEDRGSVDAVDRIGDYKRELAVIDVYRTLGAVERKTAELESRTESAVERLRSAEFSILTAIAFVAAALGLVQITLTNVTDRSIGHSIVIVISFGVILFGAVALGTWLLRRPWDGLTKQATRDNRDHRD